LIFCGAGARWQGGPVAANDLKAQDAYRALAQSNWRMASLAVVETMLGNSFDAASQQWFLRTRKEGVTGEMLAQLWTLWWNMDVRDLLPKVSMPTLVVHYRDDRFIPFEAGASWRQEFRVRGSSHWRVTHTFSISTTRDRCCAR
jgi:pimeloyl-ACP methyl ester carboxylesterase